VNADGSLAKVDAPNSAQKGVHKDWLVLELREPYEAGGKTYKPGSLIATDFNAFMAGKREFTTLFEPTDNSSLAGYTWTRDYLVLNVMEDVKNRLFVLKPGKMWSKVPFVGAPTIGTVGVGAVDDEDSNAVWLTATDFLTPTTLSIAEIGTSNRKC
jgi:prolyl oligopeptidase